MPAPNPLTGFLAAKSRAREGRKIIVMTIEGETHYYGGANGFCEDRGNAVQYERVPQDVLAKHPNARAILA